jgi:hypothetical protein
MIVPMLELEEAGGNQLVEYIVSAPKRLEEVEYRLFICFRGIEDNPVLHPTTLYNTKVVAGESLHVSRLDSEERRRDPPSKFLGMTPRSWE